MSVNFIITDEGFLPGHASKILNPVAFKSLYLSKLDGTNLFDFRPFQSFP